MVRAGGFVAIGIAMLTLAALCFVARPALDDMASALALGAGCAFFLAWITRNDNSDQPIHGYP